MKPAANLTSRLLARKGEAAPVTTFPTTTPKAEKADKKSVWPNIAVANKPKAATLVKSPASSRTVVREKGQRQEKPEDRVAMTLRLDARQHRRLRLISVHSQQSAREIMTAALDLYLDKLEAELDLTNCECLNLSK